MSHDNKASSSRGCDFSGKLTLCNILEFLFHKTSRYFRKVSKVRLRDSHDIGSTWNLYMEQIWHLPYIIHMARHVWLFTVVNSFVTFQFRNFSSPGHVPKNSGGISASKIYRYLFPKTCKLTSRLLTFFGVEQHASQLVYDFHPLLTTNVENYTRAHTTFSAQLCRGALRAHLHTGWWPLSRHSEIPWHFPDNVRHSCPC